MPTWLEGKVNEQFHLVRADRSTAQRGAGAGHIQYPPST